MASLITAQKVEFVYFLLFPEPRAGPGRGGRSGRSLCGSGPSTPSPSSRRGGRGVVVAIRSWTFGVSIARNRVRGRRGGLDASLF